MCTKLLNLPLYIRRYPLTARSARVIFFTWIFYYLSVLSIHVLWSLWQLGVTWIPGDPIVLPPDPSIRSSDVVPEEFSLRFRSAVWVQISDKTTTSVRKTRTFVLFSQVSAAPQTFVQRVHRAAGSSQPWIDFWFAERRRECVTSTFFTLTGIHSMVASRMLLNARTLVLIQETGSPSGYVSSLSDSSASDRASVASASISVSSAVSK